MGVCIGIAHVLGSFLFHSSIGLVAITTRDMRCLFDILGLDLAVKGTQQSSCIYCLQCRIVNMAAIITVECRTKFPPLNNRINAILCLLSSDLGLTLYVEWQNMSQWHFEQVLVGYYPGFSLGLNDRAQRPVVLFSALWFYSVPCRFSSAPCRFFCTLSFSESPLVSLGFHQRYFELEVAESIQLRRKVARCLCITLLFTSNVAAILDLR